MTRQANMQKQADRAKISAERGEAPQEQKVLRDYLMERRRALITELRKIEKILDLKQK